MPDLMHNLYVSEVPEAALLRAVYTSGSILLENKTFEVSKVLFDSGAIHSSYISKIFIDKHKTYFSNLLQWQPKILTLADNQTQSHTTHCIRLEMEFLDPDNISHRGYVKFNVFDMAANDMIIGLPDILKVFGQLHIKMISAVIADLTGDNEYLSKILPRNSEIHAIEQEFQRADIAYGTHIENPWTLPLDLQAPEDEDTPLPCSFTEALNYLDKEHSEVVQEYLDMTYMCIRIL